MEKFYDHLFRNMFQSGIRDQNLYVQFHSYFFPIVLECSLSIKNPQELGVAVGGNHRAEWGLTQIPSPQNKIPMFYNGKHFNKTSTTYLQMKKISCPEKQRELVRDTQAKQW